MLRGALLASMLAMYVALPAHAQSQFDATGQFTLSFKFGLPGAEKERPEVGFRVGASNTPTSQLDLADPTRRGLSLDFDRRDYTSKTFSGVGIQFGEDPFGPGVLGIADDPYNGDSFRAVRTTPLGSVELHRDLFGVSE